MTGPLANEFAQLRKALEGHRLTEQLLDGRDFNEAEHAANDAALARIEEHTHNTEKVLRFMEDFIIEHGLHDAMVEAGKPAALSTGEGTPA